MLEIKAQVTVSRFNFTLPRVWSLGAEDSHQELEHPGVARVRLLLAEQEGEQEEVSKVGVCWFGISGGHAASQLPARVAAKRLSGLFLSLIISRVFFSVISPLLLSLLADFTPTFKENGANLERGQWERTVDGNVGA